MLQFNQGSLDSLCGIYSLVNAERIINQTSEQKSKDLFGLIIKCLDRHPNSLSAVIISGMLRKHMKMILHEVLGDLITYQSLPFDGVENPDLSTFWEAMTHFLDQNEDVENKVVLLSLSGKHDHWTVVKMISEKQIQLIDSDGLRTVNRKNCTTSYQMGCRHHILCPAQTFFLGRSKNVM